VLAVITAALVLLVALVPTLAMLCGLGVLVAAAAVDVGWRSVAIAGALAGALGLAVAVATAPGPVLVAVAVGAAGVMAWRGARDPRVRGAIVSATRLPELRIVALALGAGACVLCAAVWPVTAAIAVLVATIGALALARPSLALAAAILFFGFEGSVKILLELEPTPLPGSSRAVGAAALDIALAAAVAGVLIADRGRAPRELWARATRRERVVLALVGWGLATSVLQIVQAGDPVQGVDGFRLLYAYLAVGLAAAVVAGRSGAVGRVAPAVLTITFVVATYAAFRVLIGPAQAERFAAEEGGGTFAYGGATRAVGSFSGAVGLNSFITPLAVFAIVIGLFDARLRKPAWGVAALALVGVLGSYGRGPLLAIAAALLFAVAVMASASDVSRRRKLMSTGAVAAVLAVTYGGVLVASQASDALRERAPGILNPLGDESVQLRLETWADSVEDVVASPLGTGLGTVGGASARGGGKTVTTDNSLLKVLREQGIPVTFALTAGLFALVAALTLRLRRVPRESRALGLAALAGFLSFLALGITGEYVEQPGKVVAWALLGVAAAQALLTTPARDPGAAQGAGA
jgi:hypothetical protein